MNNNANEPINPIRGKMQGETDYKGLTKREYFAGLAMQGLLAKGSTLDSADLVELATKHADNLLKELSWTKG